MVDKLLSKLQREIPFTTQRCRVYALLSCGQGQPFREV